MAFCSQCGTQFQGSFCSKCGAPAGAGPAPAATASGGGMTINVACALCYALGFITGILFLVLAPYNQNKEVRFHAFQSIFVSVGLIALHILMSIILPWGLLLMLSPLVSLGGFILWLFMLIKTYQGSKIVLPVIGPFAQQQA
jgi:uncharacterized membrane protein